MSDPDLSLITGLVAAALQAYAPLAPLTPGGDTPSCIVDIVKGDLASLVAAAIQRTGLCVAVDLLGARDDDSQTVVPFFGDVHLIVDIYEDTNTNLLTPDSEPVPGAGTGIGAWAVAAYAVQALKLLEIALPTVPYEIIPRAPGIENHTSQDDANAGAKRLRVHFTTKAAMEGREVA